MKKNNVFASRLLTAALALIVMLSLLAVAVSATEGAGTTEEKPLGDYEITASELNIRLGTGTSYDIIGVYVKGDIVQVYEISDNNWGRVKYNGQNGWISMQYAKEVISKTGTYYVSGSETLNIRAAASSDAELLGSYIKGDEVVITEINGTWGKVSFNGADGWVSTNYLSTVKPEIPQYYKVEFLDYDGKLIATQTYVAGSKVVFARVPTRAEDDENTYKFAGWDKELETSVKSDLTYTATYTATPKAAATTTDAEVTTAAPAETSAADTTAADSGCGSAACAAAVVVVAILGAAIVSKKSF